MQKGLVSLATQTSRALDILTQEVLHKKHPSADAQSLSDSAHAARHEHMKSHLHSLKQLKAHVDKELQSVLTQIDQFAATHSKDADGAQDSE